MQEPQVVSIAVGVLFAALGFLLCKLILKKQKHTFGVIVFIIFSFLGGWLIYQTLTVTYPPTWTWDGVVMHWAGILGRGMVPVVLALFGLIFSPNRVLGYVAVLAGVTTLML